MIKFYICWKPSVDATTPIDSAPVENERAVVEQHGPATVAASPNVATQDECRSLVLEKTLAQRSSELDVSIVELTRSRNALGELKDSAEDKIIDRLVTLAETSIQGLIQKHCNQETSYNTELANAMRSMVHKQLTSQCRSEQEEIGTYLSDSFEVRLANRIDRYIHELFIRLREEQERSTE